MIKQGGMGTTISNTMIDYIIENHPDRVVLSTPIDHETHHTVWGQSDVLRHGFISPIYSMFQKTYGCIVLKGRTLHLRAAKPELLVDCYEYYGFYESIGLVYPFAYDQFGRVIFDDTNTQGKGESALFAATVFYEDPCVVGPPMYVARSVYHFLADQFDLWHLFDELEIGEKFPDHPRHQP